MLSSRNPMIPATNILVVKRTKIIWSAATDPVAIVVGLASTHFGTTFKINFFVVV